MEQSASREARYVLTLEEIGNLAQEQDVISSEPVVETGTFLASAARLGISETERAALIIYLAGNPEAGVIVPDTGGVRKLRWALPGRGKSGGARVIYYYHNESIPFVCA